MAQPPHRGAGDTHKLSKQSFKIQTVVDYYMTKLHSSDLESSKLIFISFTRPVQTYIRLHRKTHQIQIIMNVSYMFRSDSEPMPKGLECDDDGGDDDRNSFLGQAPAFKTPRE